MTHYRSLDWFILHKITFAQTFVSMNFVKKIHRLLSVRRLLALYDVCRKF